MESQPYCDFHKRRTVFKLSTLTTKLIETYNYLATDRQPDTTPKLEVSQTVSFLGALYEKMRNSLEYRESHLVRKAAIVRMLKRRLLLNQKADEFTEPLVKELLWGRYLRNESVSQKKIAELTKVIEKYLSLRQRVLSQLEDTRQVNDVSEWIIDLLACKIEESLVPNDRNEAFTNFMYQWLRPSIELADGTEQDRDVLVYMGVQESFNRADEALILYRFIKVYGEDKFFSEFWQVYKQTAEYIKQPARRNITKYIRLQTPPFLILESLMNTEHKQPLKQILAEPETLAQKIGEICQEKYKQVNSRLRRAAVRSIIYIFLTKMLVAFLLEIPADQYLEGKIDLVPLLTNISFPPLLMFLIVILISAPGKDNTARIVERIKEILTHPHFSTEKRTFSKKSRMGKPLLTFVFTTIYSLTFLLVFGLIIWGLSQTGFNLASQFIFIFFLTVVSFFAYRIQQIPREYRFKEKEGVLTPVTDFLMLPILSVGKWLSEEIGKINIIVFVFDFILEAPFKAIFEVVEEWVGFLRSKREEIA